MITKEKKNLENAKVQVQKEKESHEKRIKFDFNPIEVRVSKYNLRFPVDGMF